MSRETDSDRKRFRFRKLVYDGRGMTVLYGRNSRSEEWTYIETVADRSMHRATETGRRRR